MLKRLGMYNFTASYSCRPQFVLCYAMANSSFNTLRTGDANLRFYITTAQDG